MGVIYRFESGRVACTHARHEPFVVCHRHVIRSGNGEVPAMDEAAAVLEGARSVFVLTGAGMSAESGLPTFRGSGGYWQSHRFQDLASPEGFARDPQLVWRWYNERIRAYARAQPNPGHLALARMQDRFERFTIATQNVDSLHARAGSRDVIELHGHLREARCTRCSARRSLEGGLPEAEIRHACDLRVSRNEGFMRPCVVWFGEQLPQGAWERAAQAAMEADVVLVVGTSAVVYPAAALASVNERAITIEINPDAAPGNPGMTHDRRILRLCEPAGVALPRIERALRVGRTDGRF
jgi:NAD-dependent deacetylase